MTPGGFDRRISRTGLLALGILALLAAPAFALRITDIEVRPALFWVGNGYTVDANGNPVQYSDVSPITGGGGVGVGIELSPHVSFRPALDLYGIQYAETQSGKVVPTQIETANAVLMLSALLSVPLTFSWKVGTSVDVSAAISPSFLFRIPTISWGNPNRGAITSYMYDFVRYFYPEVQSSAIYALSRRIHAGFTLRALFPVFHLWDGENVPFWDQMIVSAMVSLRFML